MREFINISILLLKKYASNVMFNLKQSEDLSQFALISAKIKEELGLGHKHLLIAKNALLNSGQSNTLRLNIVQNHVPIQTEKGLKSGFQHQRQEELLDYLNITLIKVKLFVLKLVKSAEQAQKELKELILIIQKNFVLDGFVSHVTLNGITNFQKTEHIQYQFDKFTGKKAELING